MSIYLADKPRCDDRGRPTTQPRIIRGFIVTLHAVPAFLPFLFFCTSAQSSYMSNVAPCFTSCLSRCKEDH